MILAKHDALLRKSFLVASALALALGAAFAAWSLIGGTIRGNNVARAGKTTPPLPLHAFNLDHTALPAHAVEPAKRDSIDLTSTRLALSHGSESYYLAQENGDANSVCLIATDTASKVTTITCGAQGVLADHKPIFIGRIYRRSSGTTMTVAAIVGNDVASANAGGVSGAVSNNVVVLDEASLAQYGTLHGTSGEQFALDLGPQIPVSELPGAAGAGN